MVITSGLRIVGGRADRFEPTPTFIQRMSEMKVLWCGATAVGLAAAVSLCPAMAQGPKPSGGNTWPGISQRVVPSSLSAATTNTHYEWRSGYDHHGIWRGHWVPVQGYATELENFNGPPPQVLTGATQARWDNS
jgi:hypothetical protein